VLRRVQIEAEDVGSFAFEFRIVAGHVAFETVRLQAGFLPNAMTASLLTPSAEASLRQLQCVDPSLAVLRVAIGCGRAERESAHWVFGRDDRCPVVPVRVAGSAASSARW
jgi:hypothetical protein